MASDAKEEKNALKYIMQQKCKIREMSDTIRRNEHTKKRMAQLAQ